MTETVPVIRANKRRRLVLTARLRRAGQIAFCKVKAVANFAAVGDSVTIKPEALEALTGTVRWKEDGWLGVEFNNPMYGPVVDYLAKTNAKP
jgi:hypothetical protein